MDISKVGEGIKSALCDYVKSSRATGRTIEMIKSLKRGDVVVFINHSQADEAKRTAAHLRVTLEYTVCPVKDANKLLINFGGNKGGMIFDHVWIQKFYEMKIEKAEAELKYMSAALSGLNRL